MARQDHAPHAANALANETSPYLLQHAYNPVHWYPWGDEAFRMAREQNKPVFLSVGYSTCYWCHVMEKDSFEHDDVAAILNEHFIAIKVDREERPDVDEQYMLATQLMTGRGGWPNSVWLTPEGKPWMAGTYFPREQFKQVLLKLHEVWTGQPELVEEQTRRLDEAMRRVAEAASPAGSARLDTAWVDAALQMLRRSFEPKYAGFGSAPKFPPHASLRLIVTHATQNDDAELQDMMSKTLTAMYLGGIHDHVGGGFHRYATDDHWFVPHFEKMLYDNAQLLRAFADGYQVTKNDLFRRGADDIVGWLGREMTHPDGGFYSAIDAGEVGREGEFYVWTEEEIRQLAGDGDVELFLRTYGCQRNGNWVEEASGHRPGTNILFLKVPLEQTASERGIAIETLRQQLDATRSRLLQARQGRTFPHLDDKILASWNGLMIGALAHAGRIFDEPEYTAAAERAAEFVQTQLRDGDQLLRSWRDGTAKMPGFLDDYAYLAQGLLELHAATGDSKWLEQAEALGEQIRERFEDTEHGGFFFTGAEHDELILRSKNLLGGGNIPSANAVAIEAMIELAQRTGNDHWMSVARRGLESLSGTMRGSPAATEDLLAALIKLTAAEKVAESPIAQSPSPMEGWDESWPVPDVAASVAPVELRLYSAQKAVRPGQSFDVVVALRIDSGWHVYGPKSDPDTVMATALTLKDDGRIQLGSIAFPAGTTKRDAVLEADLEFYEGVAVLRAPVTVSADAAAGEVNLEFSVRFQACDDQQCDAPRTVPLEWMVTISPDANEPLRHEKLFELR